MQDRTILLDANILYPASLRDLFLQLAVDGLIQARWTDAIQSEWIEALLRNDPRRTRARLEQTRRAMNEAVPECLISGYESIIPTLHLPDPDDRHVLAAAIAGKCEAIVTRNTSDFPESALKQYAIEIIHPDQLIAGLTVEHPLDVARAIRSIRSRLRNPPYSVREYLEILANQGLSDSTPILWTIAELFDGN